MAHSESDSIHGWASLFSLYAYPQHVYRSNIPLASLVKDYASSDVHRCISYRHTLNGPLQGIFVSIGGGHFEILVPILKFRSFAVLRGSTGFLDP